MSDERLALPKRLNSHNLDVLGAGLDRCFRVIDENAFADLLARLDRVTLTPSDREAERR